jgi:hypothetical protein
VDHRPQQAARQKGKAVTVVVLVVLTVLGATATGQVTPVLSEGGFRSELTRLLFWCGCAEQRGGQGPHTRLGRASPLLPGPPLLGWGGLRAPYCHKEDEPGRQPRERQGLGA